MTKDIEPKLKLISDYLRLKSNEMFVIPAYQRPYSWTSWEHCDKLWQDILAFISTGDEDPYFFGTIIADCSERNEKGYIQLIDGQQRTTTFLLLIKALQLQIGKKIREIPNTEESAQIKEGLQDSYNTILDILYKTDRDGEKRYTISKDEKLRAQIVLLENDSINETYKDELSNVLIANTFFEAEKACAKIPRKQKDNKYTNFFRNFKFFYNQLENLHESTKLNQFAKTFLNKCQVIEIRSWQIEQAITMFNSLNSTGMPLSDTDIISARLYSHAGEDRDTFKNKWNEFIQMANDLSAQKIVSPESILQQYMYIFRAQTKEYINPTTQTADVTTPGLRKFYLSKEDQLLKKPLSLCSKLSKIGRIWNIIKEYPIVKLLFKFNDNARIYLISYLFRFDEDEITPSLVQPIAICLLRLFAILELVEAGFSSSRFKTFLFAENIKLVNPDIDISEIAEDFTQHITKTWGNSGELYQDILDYDKNVLVFLNEYLYAKEKGKTFVLADNVNVEHIMPASGQDIESIRIDAGIDSKEEFDVIVQKIGNKILLEENINKSISNEWFKTKKQSSVKNKTGYKDSIYNIALNLVDYPSDTWTVDDITKATEKVAKRITTFIFGEEIG